MKKIFLLLCFFSSLFLQRTVSAQTSLSAIVCSGSPQTCIFQSPSTVVAFQQSTPQVPLAELQFTLNNISNMSITLPAVSPPTTPPTTVPYDATKWGIAFISSNASAAQINCSISNPCDGVTVTIPNNASGMTVTLGQNPALASGTLSVTLDFTRLTPPSQLPSDISNLINSTLNSGGTVNIAPIYDPGNGAAIQTGPSAPWQVDQGAMINGPSLTPQNLDGAFVLNITPPSDTSAVVQSTATPPTLISTANNSVSGYIIAYWNDNVCSTMGGWVFSPNPISFTSAPSYSCSYTPWTSSMSVGGTSSALGCSITSGSLLTSSIVSLTADSAAIPSLPNGTTDLQTLISNPGQEISAGCMNVVYVPATQSSFSKTGISNGNTYGATAWALNSIPPPSTPNFSLAHANISFVAGVNFPLASLAKSPDLTKSTDCFVVTAASGDVRSKSVFYWRVLRDAYLTRMGITAYYTKHAPSWAAWLNKHPSLKPPLNFLFEKSGYFFYHTGEFIKQAGQHIKAWTKTFVANLNAVLEQKASAEEFDDRRDHPRYEIFATGGILYPTVDKSFYNTYYSSQPTYHGEIGFSRIFWKDSFGFSVGGLGRYIANIQSDTASVLSSSETFSRMFYSVTAEGIAGVRYKNPGFRFLIPGVFVGIGITRFREGSSAGSSIESSQSNGITQWSPTYEGGANLDLTLLNLIHVRESHPSDILSDILLRISGSYDYNPTKALSQTGIFLQGGFVFLLK